MKLKVLLSTAAIVIATIAVGYLSGGNAVAGASTSAPIVEPTSDAPLVQWQSWATQVNSTTSSIDWATLAANSGCTVASTSIVPTNNAALGIPAGITLNSVSLELHCARPQTWPIP